MSFDMTRGKPAGLMLRFALPLILSSILQQLYTLCDSVIVGRLLGENAFAAVGAAAFLHGIPLNMLLGLTQGFGVALGQRFGAKDDEGLTRFFSAAGLLCLGGQSDAECSGNLLPEDFKAEACNQSKPTVKLEFVIQCP